MNVLGLGGVAGSGGEFDVGFVEVGEEVEFDEMHVADGFEGIEEFMEIAFAGGISLFGHLAEAWKAGLSAIVEGLEDLLLGVEVFGGLLEFGVELGLLEFEGALGGGGFGLCLGDGGLTSVEDGEGKSDGS